MSINELYPKGAEPLQCLLTLIFLAARCLNALGKSTDITGVFLIVLKLTSIQQ